jgi:hypothetical protein
MMIARFMPDGYSIAGEVAVSLASLFDDPCDFLFSIFVKILLPALISDIGAVCAKIGVVEVEVSSSRERHNYMRS